MPDTIFIFALALIIFGPKKLPEIGRQLGKLVAEFRRASNEFKMQIEEELRSAETADHRRQLAAESAAPPAATVETRELPASLTIKPPSTGDIESAESPYKAYPSEEDDRSFETDLPPETDRSPGTDLALETEPAGEEGAFEGEEGVFESAPPEPEAPALSDGAAGALEEQTTNHHG